MPLHILRLAAEPGSVSYKQGIPSLAMPAGSLVQAVLQLRLPLPGSSRFCQTDSESSSVHLIYRGWYCVSPDVGCVTEKSWKPLGCVTSSWAPFLQHCLINWNLAPELKSLQRNVNRATFLFWLHTPFLHGFNYLSIASVPWTSSHCFLFSIIRKTLNFKGLRSRFYVYRNFIRKFKLDLVVSAYNPRTHWETEIV